MLAQTGRATTCTVIATCPGIARQASIGRGSGRGGALADDAAGLGVADQKPRQGALTTAAAGRHWLLALHRQLVHPVQTPLRSAVPRESACGHLVMEAHYPPLRTVSLPPWALWLQYLVDKSWLARHPPTYNNGQLGDCNLALRSASGWRCRMQGPPRRGVRCRHAGGRGPGWNEQNAVRVLHDRVAAPVLRCAPLRDPHRSLRSQSHARRTAGCRRRLVSATLSHPVSAPLRCVRDLQRWSQDEGSRQETAWLKDDHNGSSYS